MDGRRGKLYLSFFKVPVEAELIESPIPVYVQIEIAAQSEQFALHRARITCDGNEIKPHSIGDQDFLCDDDDGSDYKINVGRTLLVASPDRLIRMQSFAMK